MPDAFEEKLQTLSTKLQNMERPCSLIERQSKCKEVFLNIRSKIIQKLQIVEKDLKQIEQKTQKYQSKVQNIKQTVSNFSCSKHSQLREIIENWVDTFNQRLKAAKQSLKSYEVATEVKLCQIEKDNEVLLWKLEDKISKNLKKINNSMEAISSRCQQQRDLIRKEFQANKNGIKKLVEEKERRQKQMERNINQKLLGVQMKINTQIQLLSQKWSAKDEKTRMIFELLVQDDI